MIDSLSITVRAFASRVSMSFLVDEILLPRLVNLSTSFRVKNSFNNSPNFYHPISACFLLSISVGNAYIPISVP